MNNTPSTRSMIFGIVASLCGILFLLFFKSLGESVPFILLIVLFVFPGVAIAQALRKDNKLYSKIGIITSILAMCLMSVVLFIQSSGEGVVIFLFINLAFFLFAFKNEKIGWKITFKIIGVLILLCVAVAYFGYIPPSPTLPDKCYASVGISCFERLLFNSEYVEIRMTTSLGYSIPAGTTINIESATYDGCIALWCEKELCTESLTNPILDAQKFMIRIKNCDFSTGSFGKFRLNFNTTDINTGLPMTHYIDVVGRVRN